MKNELFDATKFTPEELLKILNRDVERLTETVATLTDEVTKLKLNFTRVSVGLLVAWAAIQFAVKYIPSP